VNTVFLVTFLSALSLDGGPELPAQDAGADTLAPASELPPDAGMAEAEPVAKVSAPARLKLAGRVLARGTRQPLVGALVHVGVGDGTSASVETEAGGAFSIEVLPGSHPLRVQCPGFAPLTREVTVPIDSAELVVRLEPRVEGERYETVVTAEREEEPSVPIKQEELVHTAGSLGDPFRVIESLPGVAQATWPLPFYAIRGANPGNTGFFIDGVRAPALFHFALGPSVIHPFFIQEMQFFPGGYPVTYGRYVSGIVTADTAAPATDRLHVSADVRLFDAGGIVAMPFDDGKGTLAIAGRYSYTGLLLSAFSNAYSVDYWDYQIRIEHRLGPGKLTLFAFGSGDDMEQKNPDKTDWGVVGLNESLANAPQPGLAKLMFHRAQLRWDGDFIGGRLTAATVAGVDDSTVSITSVFSLPVGSRMYSVAPRLSQSWTPTGWLSIALGADAEIARVRPTAFLPLDFEPDLFHNRDALSGGTYLGLSLHGDRLIVSPGFRYEGYFEQGISRFSPSPRVLVRYRLSSHDWIKATAGQFSQMPSLPVGVPGFDSFGLASYGLQRSRQASLGFESALEDRLGLDLNVDTSVFYQSLHLTDLKNSLIPDPHSQDLLQPREGESYGLELMVRRPMKHKLYGWLAYTLSRSSRVVDGIIVPSDWDQRHIVNLVVGYRWPRNYSTSFRFHYNSGRPYPLFNRHINDVESYVHLPSFPQLDLRGDKRFIFDKFVLDAYVELVNATLSQQVFDIQRDSSGNIQQSAYRLVLPSAGVHIEW
jgi:Carboxypeptidase regulatory-like domain/TonB dependent receptor/TonB-dependent Receptor Plug Domain